MPSQPACQPSEPRYHREIRREMIRAGMRRKAGAGGTPGCAPVGYVNRRLGSRTWVEVDPVQGPLVREAFGLMATGKYTLRKLLPVMAGKGLLSRNGKPLQATGLWRILTNGFYVGHVESNGEVFPGSHEPLVDEPTFDEAQSRISARRRRGAKPQRHLSPLT